MLTEGFRNRYIRSCSQASNDETKYTEFRQHCTQTGRRSLARAHPTSALLYPSALHKLASTALHPTLPSSTLLRRGRRDQVRQCISMTPPRLVYLYMEVRHKFQLAQAHKSHCTIQCPSRRHSCSRLRLRLCKRLSHRLCNPLCLRLYLSSDRQSFHRLSRPRPRDRTLLSHSRSC